MDAHGNLLSKRPIDLKENKLLNIFVKAGTYQKIYEFGLVDEFSYILPDDATLIKVIDVKNTYKIMDLIDYFNRGLKVMDTVGIGAEIGRPYSISPIKITRIFKGGPAEKEGLKEGDVIVKINGHTIEDMHIKNVRSLLVGQEGENRTLEIRRGSEKLKKSITLAKTTHPDLPKTLSMRSLCYKGIGELK